MLYRRLDLDTNCEILWIELHSIVSPILFGVCYRPPGESTEQLTSLHCSFSCLSPSVPVVLCGDYNFPDINWSTVTPSVSSSAYHMFCDNYC